MGWLGEPAKDRQLTSLFEQERVERRRLPWIGFMTLFLRKQLAWVR
jgi:hypothetical protein